jgi:hypothetical protein
MQHKGIRIALAVIETVVGLGAIGGGIAILTGAFNQWFSVAWLTGTPFSDYTIPGLVLLLIVGGGMVLGVVTQFIQREWATLLSAALGLILLGWEVVEVAIIDRYPQAVSPSTVVQQVLIMALGLVIFALAAFLWMREYRSHSRLTSHASNT